MEHTKGTWYWVYVDGKPHNLRSKFDKNYDKHVMYVANDFTGENSLINPKDAQLIKASPKLYNVAKIALDLIKTVLYEHPDDEIAQEQKKIIEQAIAEVEG